MFQNFGPEDFFSRRCIWVNGPVIVGAGPSGLAVGACVKDQGVPFIILERANCIGSLWQKRTCDRLKLHLPKQFCQLPNFPFPEDFPEYLTKYQFINYLESYAKHFDINPHFNETVQSAKYDETFGLWRVKTISTAGPNPVEVEYICRWLVVATGENAEKVVPEFEGLQDFGGHVTHACQIFQLLAMTCATLIASKDAPERPLLVNPTAYSPALPFHPLGNGFFGTPSSEKNSFSCRDKHSTNAKLDLLISYQKESCPGSDCSLKISKSLMMRK